MAEPFFQTLSRSTVTALVVGAGLLLALPRHASLPSDFVDTFTVAFCFTFLGPYVDRLLLAIPDIRTGVGPVVRVAGWFAGGLWCYVIARWFWIRYGRELGELPGILWGGVFLIVFQLVARRRDDARA